MTDDEAKQLVGIVKQLTEKLAHATAERDELAAKEIPCPQCGALSLRCGTCGWDRLATAKTDPA